jgi:hypothetical protein
MDSILSPKIQDTVFHAEEIDMLLKKDNVPNVNLDTA